MGAGPLPAEEQIRRTRICLFEVGYHDIDVVQLGTFPDGSAILGTSADIEPAIAYQVGLLLCESEDRPICCWSCWLEAASGMVQAAQDCRDGNCRHPAGPARPPREQLVGKA